MLFEDSFLEVSVAPYIGGSIFYLDVYSLICLLFSKEDWHLEKFNFKGDT